MSLVNLEKLKGKYLSGYMRDNVENLIEFEPYHCLFSGGMSASLKVQNTYGISSKQFLEWVLICDGGHLFDTVILTTRGHDSTVDLDLDTYEEYNSPEAKESYALPEGFVVFAIRSYGDPICFNVKENDGKVYLWNLEKADFDDIWDSFEDWLTEEIDDAIRLIAEDALDPMGVKIGGEDDE